MTARDLSTARGRGWRFILTFLRHLATRLRVCSRLNSMPRTAGREVSSRARQDLDRCRGTSPQLTDLYPEPPKPMLVVEPVLEAL